MASTSPWREEPADSSPRIVHVAPVAGNQMQVHVGHGLPCRGAVVDADGVPVRSELAFEVGPRLIEQREHRRLVEAV